ncbi:MAG: GumC family protein [Sphaerochaetaceae bacterium]|jgi:succinoglycan biosynthesis transport protein ExoP
MESYDYDQAMMHSEQEGMSLKELFQILKTRLGWIIAVFILVLGAAYGYLYYATPMYESEVTILVESLQKSNDLESMLLSPGTAKIATEVEFILSRTNIQNALQSLNLDDYVTSDGISYGSNGAVGNVKGRTTVSTVKDTNIVRITVTDKIPEFARDFANALAESYNQLLGEIARNTKSVQKEFIQRQIPLNMAQLVEATDQLTKFREESNIMQLSDKSKLLSEKIAYFQLRREPLFLEVQEAKLSSQIEFESLAQVDIVPPSYEELHANSEILSILVGYKERLREYILYESIQQGAGESPDRLFVLQSALNQINKTLFDQVRKVVFETQSDDPFVLMALQRLSKAYHQQAVAEAQIEVLEHIESSFTEELGGLPILERRLLDLQRDVQVYETLRMRLMELLEEVKFAEEAVARSVTIIDEAIVSTSRSGNPIAVSPKRMLILAVAVLLGLALGILVALFIEMIDVTIKDDEVLKRLVGSHIPLLGWVPLMQFEYEKQSPSLSVYNAPLSFEAERYKFVANSISYGIVNDDLKIFSITSPGMGEGKTTLSANIATAMAMHGLKILLIDGDLRLPQLLSYFGISPANKGLVDVVARRSIAQEVIIQPLKDVPTLHLMPVGPHPPNPSAVFNSPRFKAMLEDLRDQYDYIIIDTPPLVFASELMAIAHYVDGMVINVRAGISTKMALKELLYNLDLANKNILGVVFNGVIGSSTRSRSIGSRYYSYYSNQYSKESRPKGRGRSYRRNFLKDLKQREKLALHPKIGASYPYKEKSDPFAGEEPLLSDQEIKEFHDKSLI